jgi:hypothetical protein
MLGSPTLLERQGRGLAITIPALFSSFPYTPEYGTCGLWKQPFLRPRAISIEFVIVLIDSGVYPIN